MTEDILKLIDDIKYNLFKYNSHCTDKEMYEEFIKKAYSFLDSLNLQEWHDATKEIPLAKDPKRSTDSWEVFDEKGELVIYDYHLKEWFKVVIDNYNINHYPTKVKFWCKPILEK